jgi:streptogramin lyase
VRLTTSSSCTSLFTDTTVNSVAPTTTLDAALNVNRITRAKNAAIASSSGLEGLGSTGPYSPTLTSAPKDWTITLAYDLGMNNTEGVAVAIDQNGKVFDASNITCSGIIGASECIFSLIPGSSTTATFTVYAIIDSPYSMAIDTSGNVWIPQSSPSMLNEFGPAGGMPTSFNDAGLSGPRGIAIDSTGRFWIANEAANNAIRFTPSGSTFASFTTTPSMSSPFGIAIDGSDNVWITNNGNNTVTVLNSAGTPLSFSPLSTGSLNSPTGITIDKSGNVWVANNSQFPGSITKYTTNVSPPTAANFSSFESGLPTGIEADGLGNIWFTNSATNLSDGVYNIMELDPTGASISPSVGYEDNSQLTVPEGLAIDGAGNVWVANYGNTLVNNTLLVEFVGAAGGVKTPFVGPIEPP